MIISLDASLSYFSRISRLPIAFKTSHLQTQLKLLSKAQWWINRINCLASPDLPWNNSIVRKSAWWSTFYKDLLYKLLQNFLISAICFLLWSEVITLKILEDSSGAFGDSKVDPKPFDHFRKRPDDFRRSPSYYLQCIKSQAFIGNSHTFVAFWCRVSTACLSSTQFFSLKYFGSWGLNSNVPVAPLNGHLPLEVWVTGQILCSLVSWPRGPLKN